MKRKRQSGSASAFTLVELVAVIVILGILALAVGGPTLSRIHDIRVNAAAGRIASDLRYAQRMAMASGQRTWVLFDVAANKYQLYIEDTASPGKANRLPLVHPHDATSNAVQLNDGVMQHVVLSSVSFGGASEVEFDNFGVPYDASGTALTQPGTVQLNGGDGIQVNPVGGFVERS